MADTDPMPTTISGEIRTSATLNALTPGWRTSEFWKGIICLALVALLTSGVIPTTGAGVQIAAIAGVVLTFLGYTGSRTWLKGSGAALLLVVMLAPVAGCGWLSSTSKEAAHGVVDCTKGASSAAAAELGPVLEGAVVQTASTGHLDWGPLRLLAKSWTAQIGGCALAAAVQAVAKASETTPRTMAQQIDPAALRASFHQLALERFGGASFRTAGGEL